MPQTVDYDALAKQAGAVVDYDAMAAQAGALPQTPDFRSSNAKDAAGDAVVDPNTIGTFAKHYAQTASPLPLGQLLPFPKALGGAGVAGGFENIYHAVKDVVAADPKALDQGIEAAKNGDYVGAAAHFLYWLTPVLGPMLNQAGNEMKDGKYAAGLGDTLGVATQLVAPGVPESIRSVRPGLPPPEFPRPSGSLLKPPLEDPASAGWDGMVQYGLEKGIPVDAATATGNPALEIGKHMADRSIGGSFVSAPAKRAQVQGLGRVGEGLAERVHGAPVVPEEAGLNVRGSVEDLIKSVASGADVAYERLRKIEADPQHAGEFDVLPTKAERTALSKRMAASLQGHAPTDAELAEMRRIYVELDNGQYQGRTWTEAPRKSGNAGDYDIKGAVPNTGVYDDILANAPGTSNMSNKAMRISIDQALKIGNFTNAAKGALEVARKRLAGSSDVSKPWMPPDAGAEVGTRTTVPLPVDVGAVQRAIEPIYKRLLRESELGIPMVGAKGRALAAMDGLMKGPRVVPLSVADAALSDLKAMARGKEAMPELRTEGQGLVGQVVKALDGQVKATAAKAGPEAVQALEQGRIATMTKWQLADHLEALPGEGVRVFESLTKPKDGAIGALRQVANISPEVVPQIGRAWFESRLQTAMEEGGFKADKLSADWRNLGAQTKATLFPGMVEELDRFIGLAKALNKNVNPSGSGPALAMGAQGAALWTNPVASLIAQTGLYGFTKLLYSPRVVRALTRTMETARPGVPASARSAAQAALLAAAKAAGVDLAARPVAESKAETSTP